MKNLLFLSLLIVAGCKIPLKNIPVDSDPPGARVYFQTGINENSAYEPKNYIGTTPFVWSAKVNGAGEFEYPSVFVYSTFVPPVAVLIAVPPDTNYPSIRKVFHGNIPFGPDADKAPDGVFFDFKRP